MPQPKLTQDGSGFSGDYFHRTHWSLPRIYRSLQEAIDDLDDFLRIFPDSPIAQQTKQQLQAAIDAN
jgi:outer membrane protein assembly factor BamD (BamD/ComL family)